MAYHVPITATYGISTLSLHDALPIFGAHRILANHAIRCRAPGQLLQSNGLGCMGYAVPAAIGAQLVYPERPVVAMLGEDRKSTRLNSSHVSISYAVFCLKKKRSRIHI